MKTLPFYKTTIPLEKTLFKALSEEITFEILGKGRLGNHIVKQTTKGVPLVRTTSKFTIPPYYFSENHRHILEKINETLLSEGQPEQEFNSGLIEIYDENYTKMGYHSDQNLDLEPDAYIGLW